MSEVLRPILEVSVTVPGMLLACLPVLSYSKQSHLKQMLWMLSAVLCMSIVGGLICYRFGSSALPALIATAIMASAAYAIVFRASILKSLSIILSVTSVFAYINGLAIALDAILTYEQDASGSSVWLCLKAGIAYNLMCYLFVAAAAYPATHAVRRMVEDDNFAQTWYVFWVLPAVFIVLNIFMIPHHRETLYINRTMQCYIVFNLAMLAFIVCFNTIFLMMANSLNRNAKLQLENRFLSMQNERYDRLRAAIEEVRQARHDMRHHFNRLLALMNAHEWDKARNYIARTCDRIPSMDMSFCENRAADSVISHYCALAKREGIPFSAKIDLPERVSVDEIDMCLILSNLLENALEASLMTDSARRQISTQAYMHSGRLMLIEVTNTFDGEITEKDGTFLSSKRSEAGLGIQSIRRITEKNSGACSFSHNDGVFSAKVMLRG